MRAAVLALPVALSFALPAAARADEAPSARVCGEFRDELDRDLPRAADALAVNNLLFEAARKGCVEALDRLAAAGASPLARNRDGDTPLALAARAGRKPFVDALLARASPDERRQIDLPDAHGATPLTLAIHAGRPALARDLIAAGASVKIADAQGETPLSEAAYAGDEDLVAELLARGADPDARDRSGKAPICYAAARGGARAVAALIEAGVDPNARYGADLTALMWAAGPPDLTPAERATATVKLLIARGAKLDLADDRGRTALMIAAAMNRFETARALREAGADATLRDKQGKTAADLAATPEMRALVGL